MSTGNTTYWNGPEQTETDRNRSKRTCENTETMGTETDRNSLQ